MQQQALASAGTSVFKGDSVYWLIADETNVDPNQGDFFIYGGIVLDVNQFSALHDAVVEIRSRYGFQAGDALKFHTRSRPQSIDADSWREAKAAVIEKAAGLGVDLIIYVVLHDIAKNMAKNTIMEYALNTLIHHFDCNYLARKQDRGVVCLDRVDDSFAFEYFKSKFSTGIEMPSGYAPSLDRILHYSMSSDGASHVSSVVDICIGGIRYCINAATGKGTDSVARLIFPKLSRMLWFKQTETGRQIGGYGFLQHPKTVRFEPYRLRYKALTTTLTEYTEVDA